MPRNARGRCRKAPQRWRYAKFTHPSMGHNLERSVGNVMVLMMPGYDYVCAVPWNLNT